MYSNYLKSVRLVYVHNESISKLEDIIITKTTKDVKGDSRQKDTRTRAGTWIFFILEVPVRLRFLFFIKWRFEICLKFWNQFFKFVCLKSHIKRDFRGSGFSFVCWIKFPVSVPVSNIWKVTVPEPILFVTVPVPEQEY